MREDKNSEYRAAVEAEYAILMTFIGRYKRGLLSAVPDARVLEWPGAEHYLFIAREAEVLRELHAFVRGLR